MSTTLIALGQKKKHSASKEKDIVAAPASYKEIGSSMPPIRIITKNNKVITQKDVDNDASLLVMMFNPTCDHCIETAQTLKNNAKLFNRSKLLLMATPNMLENLQYFEDMTHYPDFPLLQVGLDSAGFIDKSFIYKSLPQINVYDKNRKLVKIFNGETPIDSLKPYIE